MDVSAANTLTFTSSAVDVKQSSTSLTLTSSGSREMVFRRSASNTLTMTHTRNLSRIANRARRNVLAFTQVAKIHRVRHASATNSMSFSGHLVRDQHEGDAANTLSLSTVADFHRTKYLSASNTLALTKTATRNAVFNVSASNTLVFKSTRKVFFGALVVEIPNVQYVNYKRAQHLMVLAAPDRSITLPAPEFNDGVSWMDTLTIKRTMTGRMYTYIKRTDTRKLDFDLVIWTQKARELKQFLLDHSSEYLTLYYWNNTKWLVKLSSNPVEFTAQMRWSPQDEKVSVSLEFIGVQI